MQILELNLIILYAPEKSETVMLFVTFGPKSDENTSLDTYFVHVTYIVYVCIYYVNVCKWEKNYVNYVSTFFEKVKYCVIVYRCRKKKIIMIVFLFFFPKLLYATNCAIINIIIINNAT